MSRCILRRSSISPSISPSIIAGRVSHSAVPTQIFIPLAARPLLPRPLPRRHLKIAPLSTRHFHSSIPTKISKFTRLPHPMKNLLPPPSVDSLQSQLSSLGISDPLPIFSESNPTTNPVDVFRCYIADTLAPIAGVDVKLIYEALEWTQSFDKGDLILAIPRLRLKGKKPDVIAKEWAEKVSDEKNKRKNHASSCFSRAVYLLLCYICYISSSVLSSGEFEILSDSYCAKLPSFPKIPTSFP